LVGKETDINKENKDFNTPLTIACENENKSIMKILIENGAIINKCNKMETIHWIFNNFILGLN